MTILRGKVQKMNGNQWCQDFRHHLWSQRRFIQTMEILVGDSLQWFLPIIRKVKARFFRCLSPVSRFIFWCSIEFCLRCRHKLMKHRKVKYDSGLWLFNVFFTPRTRSVLKQHQKSRNRIHKETSPTMCTSSSKKKTHFWRFRVKKVHFLKSRTLRNWYIWEMNTHNKEYIYHSLGNNRNGETVLEN